MKLVLGWCYEIVNDWCQQPPVCRVRLDPDACRYRHKSTLSQALLFVLQLLRKSWADCRVGTLVRQCLVRSIRRSRLWINLKIANPKIVVPLQLSIKALRSINKRYPERWAEINAGQGVLPVQWSIYISWFFGSFCIKTKELAFSAAMSG